MNDKKPDLECVPKNMVWHHVRLGRLILTKLDIEATDKTWRTAEITRAAMRIYDLSLNLLDGFVIDVKVPERVTISPEAALITRYKAEDMRSSRREPPQIAVAKIYDALKTSPVRLWDVLGEWSKTHPELIDQKRVRIPGRTGKVSDILVRHMPLRDNEGNVVRHVRVHEGGKAISYLADKDEKPDYRDESGGWKIKTRANTIGRLNLGYNSVSFDNQLLAAAAHRANFPSKEVFFVNRRGLGNDSADVLTMALASHFFSMNGRERIVLGKTFNHEISQKRISAKLDQIMDVNTRPENPELGIKEGVRVGKGAKHDRKKGHNDPDYDNDKTVGLYKYLRENDSNLVRQVELCADVEYLRSYMTQDREDTEFKEAAIASDKSRGFPISNPLRCIVTSRDSKDGEVYEAVPVIVVGADERHGKFNRVLCMRADIDYRSYRYKGKSLLEMPPPEIVAMMKEQSRKPGAIFHEHHLKKRHKVAFGIETGLKAGLAPGFDRDSLTAIRDYVTSYVDDNDRLFTDKVMEAYATKHPFWYEADKIPIPYPEEEIYTPFESNTYYAVKLKDGQVVRLPNLITARIHDARNHINAQITDTVKRILKPQPLEWERTYESSQAYIAVREKVEKDLSKYQSYRPDPLVLPAIHHDQENAGPADVMVTLLNDRLTLMEKIQDLSKAPEIQQLVESEISGKVWQRLPYDRLVTMPEHELVNLDDHGRLRVVFEENPSHPTYRYALRQMADMGYKSLLTSGERGFLKAETALYVHGLPYEADPEKQRIPSALKTLKRISEIRNNLRMGKIHLAAARPEEKGVYQIFAEEPQLAESILAGLEKDCCQRMKAYPFKDREKLKMGFNPISGEPILKIKYEIPGKDYLIVRIPDALLENPAKDNRLGHSCVLVPDNPRIRNAKHIVLQGAQTGRLFYAAEHIVHEWPLSRSFDRLNDVIRNGFLESGMQSPQHGLILSCAEIPRIAQTHTAILPDIKIPQQAVTATIAPRLANLPATQPLRGIALRKYDLEIEKGSLVRLRATDDEGGLTGEEVTVKIQKVSKLSLAQVIGKVKSGAWDDKTAMDYGFANTSDMCDRLSRLFTAFDEDVRDSSNEIIFLSYEPILHYIEYRTEHAPRACFNRSAKGMFAPEVIGFPGYIPPVPMLKLYG